MTDGAEAQRRETCVHLDGDDYRKEYYGAGIAMKVVHITDNSYILLMRHKVADHW